MTTRWLFSVDGQAGYYQEGNYIYTEDGACVFSVSDGWWYPIKDGGPSFYEKGGWIYSSDGKPSFYFG